MLYISRAVVAAVVQLPSFVRLLATPWMAAGQVSLSLTISWSLSKFMSIEMVMPHSAYKLFFIHNIVLEAVTKTIKKKCKKAKWMSEEALQITEKGERSERERYTQQNVDVQRITRRDEAF